MNALRQRMVQASPAARVELLFAFLESAGRSKYDEEVTQLQHILQCAHLAKSETADRESVASALLHDIGHLLIHLGLRTGSCES